MLSLLRISKQIVKLAISETVGLLKPESYRVLCREAELGRISDVS